MERQTRRKYMIKIDNVKSNCADAFVFGRLDAGRLLPPTSSIETAISHIAGRRPTGTVQKWKVAAAMTPPIARLATGALPFCSKAR